MGSQRRSLPLAQNVGGDRVCRERDQVVSVTEEIGEMVEIPHQPAEFRMAGVQELELIAQILDALSELVGSFV